MPYLGETANRSTHGSVVEDQRINDQLRELHYVTPPSNAVNLRIANRFRRPPLSRQEPSQFNLVAVDGSNYCTTIGDSLPQTQVSFTKIGAIRLNGQEYLGLRDEQPADPFAVAALEDGYDSFSYVLPGSNVRTTALSDPVEALRFAINEVLNVKIGADGRQLMDTYFYLASRRKGRFRNHNPNWIWVDECAVCGSGPIAIGRLSGQCFCPTCGAAVYPADALKLWQEPDDSWSIETVTNRVMMTMEHLLLVHNVRRLYLDSPEVLGTTAFMVDGPLAVFGWGCQWLHAPIMETLHDITADLESQALGIPVIFGLQKSGYMAQYATFLNRIVPANRLFAVDDQYRYTHIKVSPSAGRSKYGFGSETYYGQDFIFKSSTGRVYVMAMPYPFPAKESVAKFQAAKLALPRYKTLGSALSLISHFECDLFENSLSPMVLAHRYTSISTAAGGGVLDELAASAITPVNSGSRPSYHLVPQTTSVTRAPAPVGPVTASAPVLPQIKSINGVLNL